MKNSVVSLFRRPKHWIALLLAVIALHLIMIDWLSDRLGFTGQRQSEREETDGAISVSLQAARKTAAAAPAMPAAKPEPAETASESEAESEVPAAPSPESTASAVPSPSEASAGTEASGAGATVGSKVAALPGAEDAGSAARTFWSISPPPSVQLSYRIQAQQKGQSMFGSGHMTWQNDGKRYTLEGESRLLFFTVLNFRSEGTIEAESGISPVLYNEKRFRKPETNTHFHRERELIIFSASTRTYPRQGGEQDRASVTWQLAGIGRHDSERFRPGVKFPIFVAGTRKGEIWNFNVAGLEEMETAAGPMKAWHLTRKPRADSYEQSLDIWLAPEKDWYPVRLRYTDRNGDYLDMSVAEIRHVSK